MFGLTKVTIFSTLMLACSTIAAPMPQQQQEKRALATASNGIPLITTANNWRKLYGLPEYKWSTKLAGNAYTTGEGGNGIDMIHKLGDGTFGQVIVPGNQNEFELYYPTWLCEVPDLPFLETMCGAITALAQINVSGQTGHHDILVSKAYSTIGCAFFPRPVPNDSPWKGLWTCDLGYDDSADA